MKVVPMKVECIDYMGGDLAVVNAARVSFNKWHTEIEDGDERLIKYLAKNGHWTPFGHSFVTFRVKAPIFVARQLVKHQVGLVWNEVSRRYVDSEPEFWMPLTVSTRPDGSIKQGAGEEHEDTISHTLDITDHTQAALQLYQTMIADGVAPEQARMVLPLNTMTEWIWSGSLMAFARVCKLRLDHHAQKETRVIAEQIDLLMKDLFPISWEALLCGE